ncbi:hypothetical protein OG21DRAFT_1250651 [Imleria badia]|nr:hypothetical protein OG21DRAFT_1250651 [Imleria badia]
MSMSKIQASLAMSGRENRVFGLDHSLHTRFLQVKTNCVGRERLVDDIGKLFGHLNSIFSSSRGDEMLGMSNVGMRKLGRMTFNSLGKKNNVWSEAWI